MTKLNTPLNFIDVFSGAGGLSCGLEKAGMRCLLGIDMDKNAIETFKANHHYAETYCGSVIDLSEKKLKELLKGQTVHAVVGGPPCQGFSTVGLGNPNDIRNTLFREFVRLVKITNTKNVCTKSIHLRL
jgi:DNA (cytosine-5)-methyltransferase 1